MEEIDYEIVLKFPCYCKVGELLADLENWQQWKAKKAEKAEKRDDDQRGKKTKIMHQKAREFQAMHPIYTYRESYKIANERK